jgi:hypothetical protein
LYELADGNLPPFLTCGQGRAPGGVGWALFSLFGALPRPPKQTPLHSPTQMVKSLKETMTTAPDQRPQLILCYNKQLKALLLPRSPFSLFEI